MTERSRKLRTVGWGDKNTTRARGNADIYVYNFFVCVRACVFAIGLSGQTAGPIGTKLDTRIQFDPGRVLGKSRSAMTAVGC